MFLRYCFCNVMAKGLEKDAHKFISNVKIIFPTDQFWVLIFSQYDSLMFESLIPCEFP